MQIAAMTFRLHAPWVHSLKEKRMVVKSLVAKTQNRFHASVAEIDEQDIILVVMAVLIVMNLVSFALMGIDKRRAQRGAWRISEKALFLTTACFGGLGGVMGMRLFHHKTKHWYFRVFFPLLLLLQIAVLAAGAYLLMR